MEILRCRTRLAVLWIFRAFFSIGMFILALLEPDVLKVLMAGNIFGTDLSGGMKIFYGAALWFPWIMAWAAMTLKLSINRWSNTILGLIMAIMFSIGTFQGADNFSSAILINNIFQVILHLLIAWYGWTLPKEEA